MNAEFRPLEGIRVVELSHMIFGPCCGLFLASFGAEVVKVEPPGGDKTRQLTGMGVSFFPTFNRGKKSVALDMKSAEGRIAFDSLLATADVLLENFRDGSLARMGIAQEQLADRFPRLITVACKGFLTGPYQRRSALDEVVQMMTGLAYMTGPPGRPLRAGSSVNDIMGGLFGAYSVVGALREREHTGRGRHVRVGLFENSLLLVAQHMLQFGMLGVEPDPMPNRAFSWPVYDIFGASDGRDIFIAAVSESHWQTLCTILKMPELLSDPRLQTRIQQINAREWTIPRFRKAVSGFSFNALASILERENIPFAPVARPAEMYDDPQAQAAGGLSYSRLPGNQRYRFPALPVEVDCQRVGRELDVPGLGEHTLQVLQDLGIDKRIIEKSGGEGS
ncbi:MAG: CoA transferase [Rhodobacteraceae bacterium]|nr:CoA transferase [Paracoccaceae bacterium]